MCVYIYTHKRIHTSETSHVDEQMCMFVFKTLNELHVCQVLSGIGKTLLVRFIPKSKGGKADLGKLRMGSNARLSARVENWALRLGSVAGGLGLRGLGFSVHQVQV